MSRTARWVVAIALAQAALAGVYWLVERHRPPTPGDALGTQPPRRLDMPMPALTVVRRDGSRAELAAGDRPTLVHVWATWCPPCRAELPSLLALPSHLDVAVVAIALDESWDDVEDHLKGPAPASVVLADRHHVRDALEARSLPVTFLLDRSGRLTLRFDGTRDWTDDAFLRTHLGRRRLAYFAWPSRPSTD
ncbi:MAG: TlpA disulfide reductase family protein [Myxococcales bacterium]|jgi:thiol-disulfide isomerase/thioredoxin